MVPPNDIPEEVALVLEAWADMFGETPAQVRVMDPKLSGLSPIAIAFFTPRADEETFGDDVTTVVTAGVSTYSGSEEATGCELYLDIDGTPDFDTQSQLAVALSTVASNILPMMDQRSTFLLENLPAALFHGMPHAFVHERPLGPLLLPGRDSSLRQFRVIPLYANEESLVSKWGDLIYSYAAGKRIRLEDPNRQSLADDSES